MLGGAVAQWRRRGGSMEEERWLNARRRGGSMEEERWLNGGGEVAQC